MSGGIIINKDEIPEIYITGKGRVVLRAKTEIKDNSILITELPYQVNKAKLLQRIVELKDSKKDTFADMTRDQKYRTDAYN